MNVMKYVMSMRDPDVSGSSTKVWWSDDRVLALTDSKDKINSLILMKEYYAGIDISLADNSESDYTYSMERYSDILDSDTKKMIYDYMLSYYTNKKLNRLQYHFIKYNHFKSACISLSDKLIRDIHRFFDHSEKVGMFDNYILDINKDHMLIDKYSRLILIDSWVSKNDIKTIKGYVNGKFSE